MDVRYTILLEGAGDLVSTCVQACSPAYTWGNDIMRPVQELPLQVEQYLPIVLSRSRIACLWVLYGPNNGKGYGPTYSEYALWYHVADMYLNMILVILRASIFLEVQGISYGAPSIGPLPALKGSELWAPSVKAVCNGARLAVQGFGIRGTYQRTADLLWILALVSHGQRNLQRGI